MYLLVDAKSLWREAEMCVVDLESALFLAPVADANEAPPGQHLNAAAHAACCCLACDRDAETCCVQNLWWVVCNMKYGYEYKKDNSLRLPSGNLIQQPQIPNCSRNIIQLKIKQNPGEIQMRKVPLPCLMPRGTTDGPPTARNLHRTSNPEAAQAAIQNAQAKVGYHPRAQNEQIRY